MTDEEVRKIIKEGENLRVEFKRCGNGLEKDVYETVCSFSNRFGGDILCGVLDDGQIQGIPEKAVPSMLRNFANVTTNPDLFSPILFITPQAVRIDGKLLLHIHVPISPDVHSFKDRVFDRVHESDIVIKGNSKLSEMIIRKQNIFTEQKIFPYATIHELKPQLIEVCRQRAVNLQPNHPWKGMTDGQLIQSAGLVKKDLETGKSGLNLAGLLLLGRDDVISSVCPQYKTDALLRRVNVDRYDDREIIQTNLVESYEQLMQFARKHLSDKFHLDGVQRINLRDKIVREVISNILMHREYSSAYSSRFVIEKERMYTENPCKALNQYFITPENCMPVSKNPIIAKFFTNIGNADELGSGTRNLFKYTMLYSGRNPEMYEDDIFKITVPLDENYSTDFGTSLPAEKTELAPASGSPELSEKQRAIIELIRGNGSITQQEMAEQTGLSRRAVQNNIGEMQKSGLLRREGSKRDGRWVVVQV